jgi:hypothetical protein
MKYVVLIYRNPASWEALSGQDRQGLMGEFDAFQKELDATGEFVSGTALGQPTTGKTVRVRDGVPAVTDGPFAEAKDHLAGYLGGPRPRRSRSSTSPAYFPAPGPAVLSGLELVERVDRAGLPPARVGIAAGPVVFREGDCFGRTVNAWPPG